MLVNYNKLIILIISLLLTSGCIRFVHPDQGAIAARNNKQSSATKNATHHYVKRGETLYSIAFEYGRDHRDVARWNNIRRPYTIFPKQKLRVIPIVADKKNQKRRTSSRTVKKDKVTSPPAIVQSAKRSLNKKLVWQWPTEGKVVSTFSFSDPGRRGIDIVGRKGQPVRAATGGRVVYKGNGLRGYGNLIILKHNETFFSAYAHTENVVVKENEKVKLGQTIADMGNTSSVNTKLHFEIRRNGKPVDPMKYLPKRR